MADATKLEGIHQIPELVRSLLHPLVQMTWLDGYNAAISEAEAAGETISKQAAAEAGARRVHNVHAPPPSLMPYAEQGEGIVSLFMQSISTADVTVEKRADGTALLRGLPLMRPGTWNGNTYTDADLREIADNTNRKVEADRVKGYAAPYHTFDSNGKPLPVPAGDNLGWMAPASLRFDPADDYLKSDVELLDAKAVADLESGRMKYVSAEVWSGGKIGTTGEKIGPYMPGFAFVLNPAVKGMDYRLVTNAEEIPEAATRAAETDLPAPTGGERRREHMTVKEKVLAALGLLHAAAGGQEVAPDALAPAMKQLEEVAGDPALAETPPAATPTPEAPKTLEEFDPIAAAELATLREFKQAAEQAQAEAEKAERDSRTVAVVDKLCDDAILPPAAKPHVLALAHALVEADVKATVTMLAEDGTEKAETVDGLAALDAAFRAYGAVVSDKPTGALFTGSEVNSGEPVPLPEDKIKASADRVRGRERKVA